jgi:hypothetical protein
MCLFIGKKKEPLRLLIDLGIGDASWMGARREFKQQFFAGLFLNNHLLDFMSIF